MIIIADSPRPHKRILQKGEWRDGGGGRGAAQTALRAVSAAFGRSGGSAAGGCAPISAPFAHPPGGPALSRKPAKKQGGEGAAFPAEGARQRARASGRRPGRAFRAADAGKACVPRLRRSGLRPSLSRTIPISPHNPAPNCHHVPYTSPAQTSPRYHQILPNPPPSPGKIPPHPRKKAPRNRHRPYFTGKRQNSSAPPQKKRRPHRDGALLTFFGFSPAWQGRHGCGRGSPHGPAPPPALCRRRG